MPLSPEEAKEYGKQGAEASKAARRLPRDPEERAKELLLKKAPALARELLKVALNPEEYDVPDKVRVGAMMKALEWGIGRPTQTKPQEKEEQQGGLSIGVRQEENTQGTETTGPAERDAAPNRSP